MKNIQTHSSQYFQARLLGALVLFFIWYGSALFNIAYSQNCDGITFPTDSDCSSFMTVIDLENTDPNAGFVVPYCDEETLDIGMLDVTRGSSCSLAAATCEQGDNGDPSGPITDLYCHQIVFKRTNTAEELTFSVRIGQGNSCNGELDATFEVYQNGGQECRRIACGGPQNVDEYTFPVGVDEIIIFGCVNSSAQISLCGLCIIPPPCEFTATCPADLDLGTYDCNNLDMIPDCPTLMVNGRDLRVDNAAGDYGIDIGDEPCGEILVLCEDDINPNVCTGQDINRTITIIDDLNANGTLDAGEDHEICVFTISITKDMTPPTNIFCPAGGDVGCNPDPSAYTAGTAEWEDDCGISRSGVIPGTPVNTTGCTYEVVHVHYAEDNCGQRSECREVFTFERATAPVIVGLPAGGDLGCNPASLPSCETLFARNECRDDIEVTCTPGTARLVDGCHYIQEFTYSATDCGQTTTEKVEYSWCIVTKPKFDNCPTGPINLGCNPTPPTCDDLEITASNECGNIPVTCVPGDILTDGCQRKQTFVYTATDDKCDLESTCEVTYTWYEVTEPVFDECPVGGDLGCNPTLPTCLDLTARNECGVVPVTCVPGDILTDGCQRKQTFVYTATDPLCQLSSTCEVTYTWYEVTEPVFDECPVGGDLGCNPTLPTCLDLTARNECGVVPVTCVPGDILTDGCQRKQTFVYTATDPLCQLSSTCEVTYTWYEVTEPVFDECPVGGDLGCNPTLPTCLDLTARNECGVVPVTCVPGDILTDGCQRKQTFVYTATDPLCQLSSTCEVTYTWYEVTAPEFDNCPDGKVIDLGCNPAELPVCDPSITASNECGDVPVTCVAGLIEVDNWNRKQTFTYTATDPLCGLSTTCTITYTWWVDNNKPIIDFVPDDISLPCGSAIPSAPTVIAVDIESGVVPVTVRLVRVGGTCAERYQRIWRAEDECGNVTERRQNIYFYDNEPPSLKIPGDVTLQCGEDIPEPYYEVSDNCSQWFIDIDVKVTHHNDCEFTMTRIYTARDGCTNYVRDTQIINVVDTIAPVIVPINPMIADIPNGGEMIMYGCEMEPRLMMEDLHVYDECCTATYSTSDQLVANGVCDLMGFFRLWKCSSIAVDGAGNTTEYSFYVKQYDNTAPVIHNVPEDLVLECDAEVPAPDTTVYVEDDCSLVTIPQFSEEIIEDKDDPNKKMYVRRWWAEDQCGNLGYATQTITVCGFDAGQVSASIGNTVWRDLDENGLQNVDEEGLNDIRVDLLRMASTTPDTTYAIVKSTTTATYKGQEGNFFFDFLPAGEYYIQIANPSHLEFTKQDVGLDETMDSDIDPETGMTAMVELVDHLDLMSVDGGLIPARVSDAGATGAEDAIDNSAQEGATGVGITVFPNPFQEVFHIEYVSSEASKASMIIYDHLGRIVKNQNVGTIRGVNRNLIDVSHLPIGTYILQVKYDGKSEQKLIVKSH